MTAQRFEGFCGVQMNFSHTERYPLARKACGASSGRVLKPDMIWVVCAPVDLGGGETVEDGWAIDYGRWGLWSMGRNRRVLDLSLNRSRLRGITK